MATAKVFFLAAPATSALFLVLGLGTLSARQDKLNPHQPVPATNLVLAPKITLRGNPPRPAGGGSRRRAAATGVLGALCNGAKYAIVAGISDYPGVRNDLEYADDDAIDMAKVLEMTYGFPVDRILLLVDHEATRANIMGAIEALGARATADDEVVFFFSGHGMSGVAADGDHERRDEAIVTYHPLSLAPLWDGELREAFRDFQTNRIIFIFDICMAGGMNDLQAPGRVILMAAPERGYAYEGDEWGHGELTYYLMEGVVTGAANTHDYGFRVLSEPALVTAEQAFDYTRTNCTWDRPVIGDSFPDDLLP